MVCVPLIDEYLEEMCNEGERRVGGAIWESGGCSIDDYPEKMSICQSPALHCGVCSFNRCLSGENRIGNLSAVVAGLPDEKNKIQT